MAKKKEPVFELETKIKDLEPGKTMTAREWKRIYGYDVKFGRYSKHFRAI